MSICIGIFGPPTRMAHSGRPSALPGCTQWSPDGQSSDHAGQRPHTAPAVPLPSARGAAPRTPWSEQYTPPGRGRVLHRGADSTGHQTWPACMKACMGDEGRRMPIRKANGLKADKCWPNANLQSYNERSNWVSGAAT